MKLERYDIKACCGRTSIMFKVDRPLGNDFISFLQLHDFVVEDHLMKAGIIYMHNSSLIVTGPVGSDRLQVKCKIADCAQKINDFEMLAQKLE